MDITKVVWRGITPEVEKGNANITMFGFADVTMNGVVLTGLKLKGSIASGDPEPHMFLDLPVRKGKNKAGDTAYFPIYRPATADARRALTAAVLQAAQMANRKQAEPSELPQDNTGTEG